MSMENGIQKINCPLHDNWHDIKGAMRESATSRASLKEVLSKVDQLDELPSIASEIRSLNRNNTILLVILGSLLIINAISNTGVNVKGSIPGGSVEVSGHK